MWQRTADIADAPAGGEEIEIEFASGNPVAVNGEGLSPAGMLARLNELGGRHGIGRADLVENRYIGMKSRGCYETPGGTILLRARRAMESLTLDREVVRLRDDLGAALRGIGLQRVLVESGAAAAAGAVRRIAGAGFGEGAGAVGEGLCFGMRPERAGFALRFGAVNFRGRRRPIRPARRGRLHPLERFAPAKSIGAPAENGVEITSAGRGLSLSFPSAAWECVSPSAAWRIQIGGMNPESEEIKRWRFAPVGRPSRNRMDSPMGAKRRFAGRIPKRRLGTTEKNIFRRTARFSRESAIIPSAISISMGARLSGGPPNTTPDNGRGVIASPGE